MVVEISDWNDLDNVRNDLNGDYVLVNDLDSATNGYAGVGDDFKRLGVANFEGDAFTGNFDGNGFAIKDFVLADDGSTDVGHGLFGGMGGATVENLSVSGTADLTGFAIEERVGGVVGDQRDNSTIQNCASHVDVTAPNGDRVGGLVGNSSDTVTDSYATGSVDADSSVGGLVGFNADTTQKSYAVGLVTGNTNVGGLVGRSVGNEIDSYWDTETTGQSTSDGGTGLTTAEMQGSEAETNMDFDFLRVWETVEENEPETIDGQITLDEVAAETATVILHNFSEPESIVYRFISADGYPILSNVDKDEQLDLQNIESEERGNIARTETDTDGNYSADIRGATGDTIAIAVDFDDGTERYGRLVTTVLE